MIRRVGLGIVAAAAGLVLTLAGCGGSDGTTASSSTPSTTTTPSSAAPTKADYLAEANARCAGMNAESQALQAEFLSNPQTPESQARIIRAGADLIEETVAELRALPRPAGDESTLDAAYDKADELPPAARRLADAIEQGDDAQVPALDEAGSQAQQLANDAADAYGLTTCGSGSDSGST